MLVRFYAVGREIAGCNEYRANATDIPSLRAELVQQFGNRMGQLFDAASLMSGGRRLEPGNTTQWGTDDLVDLLPPFAGG